MPPIETPGSDILSGNPSGETPPADTTTTTTTEATQTDTSTETPAEGNVAPAAVRFDAFDVPEAHLTAVTAKGWKSVGDVLESYAALEKLTGLEKGDALAQGRILTRPKPDAKPEEIADYFGKAAAPFVPKSAADYGITAPEGVDSAPFNEAGELFLKAGLPSFYANKLVEAVGESEKAKAEAFVAQSNTDVVALQTEWGAEFETKSELGRRAVAAAGLDADSLQRLELALGTKTMLSMFAEFGKQYAEIASPNPTSQGTGNSQFRMSAEQAKAKIDTLKNDSEFQARYLSPNMTTRQAAIKEMEELHKVAFPEGA